ncbi:hypothetical protein D3C81_1823030 [compost metagenome]
MRPEALQEFATRIGVAMIVDHRAVGAPIHIVLHAVLVHIGFPAHQAFGLLQAQFDIARGFLAQVRIADIVGGGRFMRAVRIQLFNRRRALRD